MKTIIIAIILIYSAVCAIFYIFQRSFLYFPQPASMISAGSVSFDNKGQILSGWVLNPGKSKLLLYYGGNASAVETHAEFLTQVAPDYTIYLIPYRGYGQNKGQPTEQALYSDALTIYDQLKDNYQSISLIGRSLGSGVASKVAASRDVEKLVLITPYDSIANVAKDYYPFLPVNLLARDKFESINNVANIKAETLILIAENDQVIDRKRSEALAAVFPSQQLTKVIIADAGHNDIGEYDKYALSINDFLKSQDN